MTKLSARILILALAVGVAAGVNITRPWEDQEPATQLSTAGVELGDDTARIVE